MINDPSLNRTLLVIGRNIENTQTFLEEGTELFELSGYSVSEGYCFLKSQN